MLGKYKNNHKIVIVTERRKGKSIALNTGIKYAKGDLLIFLDDDVVPDKNWFKNLINAVHDNPAIKVFSGKISIDREKIPQWINKSFNLRQILFAEQSLGEDTFVFPDDQYPSGPFIAVRKEAIKVDNPWPENIGPGTKLPVGDERVFLKKISRPDSEDRLYVADSIIFHRSDKENNSFTENLMRCFHGGYAAGATKISRTKINSNSTINLIFQRIKTCKSLRELICIIFRAYGYYYSSRNMQRIKSDLNI